MIFSYSIMLDGQPCVAADPVKYPEAARLATSYWCPVGPAVGRAWVLMQKRHLDLVTDGASPITLAFNRINEGDEQSTPQPVCTGMYKIRSFHLGKGPSNTENAIYLVELADVRILGQRFSTIDQVAANVLSFANDDDYLFTTTGATWTSLVASIWGKLPNAFGAVPALPFAVDGIPENWNFVGLNAWGALHVVLHKIGMTTAYNPVANSFSIVALSSSGAVDREAFGTPLFDRNPTHGKATSGPETVSMFSHITLKNIGQENDIQRGNMSVNNWLVGAVNNESQVATELTGAAPGTVLPLWDDLRAHFNESNSQTNTGNISARADARTDEVVANANMPAAHFGWPGIHRTVLPGASVRLVIWRNHGPNDGGTVTEIVSGPDLPSQVGIWNSPDRVLWTPIHEPLAPPDMIRAFKPGYPRLPDVVRITGGFESSPDPGDVLTTIGPGVYEGQIERRSGGTIFIQDEGDCYIHVVNQTESADADSDGIIIRMGQRFMGRLSGFLTIGNDGRSVYVVIAQSPDPGPRFGIAIENWTQPTSDDLTAYVNVHPVDDLLGTNEDTGTTIKVFLPRHSLGDPNVIAGDVIGFQATFKPDLHSGAHDFVCVTDYMDAKFLTVTMWIGLAGNIRPGWAAMNGSDNATPGGSGKNMEPDSLFPRWGDPAGNVAGDNVHGHGSPSTDTAAADITVDPHDDHSHEIIVSSTHAAAEEEPPGDLSLQSPCTTGVKEEEDCTNAAPAGVLAHTVNANGHVHDITIPDGPNVPKFMTFIFIERIDNSIAP